MADGHRYWRVRCDAVEPDLWRTELYREAAFRYAARWDKYRDEKCGEHIVEYTDDDGVTWHRDEDAA